MTIAMEDRGKTPESEDPTPTRVIDRDAGLAMVVTDLHGDWDAYERYRDRFLQHQARGEAEVLLVLGDMIHRSGPAETDASLEIVLDLMRLQAEQPDNVICLLGNHELPHIYSIMLQKGSELYTPRFEAALGAHRDAVIDWFMGLPFYIRTKAGVTLCHAGASSATGEKAGLQQLWHFSHQRIWDEAKAKITPEERPSMMRTMREMYNKTYNEMARTYFAVSGIKDPRYDNFLIGTVASSANPKFELLWSAMFTRNELEYGDYGYNVILNTMLQALSLDYHQQVALVTGHIDCRGGYTLINKQQLRLASAKHAQPREAGLYLLFDMADEEIETAVDLSKKLHSVFN